MVNRREKKEGRQNRREERWKEWRERRWQGGVRRDEERAETSE